MTFKFRAISIRDSVKRKNLGEIDEEILSIIVIIIFLQDGNNADTCDRFIRTD